MVNPGGASHFAYRFAEERPWTAFQKPLWSSTLEVLPLDNWTTKRIGCSHCSRHLEKPFRCGKCGNVWRWKVWPGATQATSLRSLLYARLLSICQRAPSGWRENGMGFPKLAVMAPACTYIHTCSIYIYTHYTYICICLYIMYCMYVCVYIYIIDICICRCICKCD